jgi:hypothetical protein
MQAQKLEFMGKKLRNVVVWRRSSGSFDSLRSLRMTAFIKGTSETGHLGISTFLSIYLYESKVCYWHQGSLGSLFASRKPSRDGSYFSSLN